MLYFRERPGPGRAVVLVHGNFASSDWWRPVLEAAAPELRLVAVDLPGCGRSPAPPDPEGYRLDRVARSVKALIDHLGLGQIHLVAHSLGAAVAIHLVEQMEDRVLDLTLFGPAPLDGVRGMRDGDGELARLLRSFDPGDPAKLQLLRVGLESSRLLGTHRFRMEDAIRAQMPAARLDPEELRDLGSTAARQSNDTILGYLRALGAVDHRERASRLRLPVAVVWGELDRVVPRSSAARIAATFPLGHLEVWPGVGHAPMLEAPSRTVAHLDAWWARSEEDVARTGPVSVPGPMARRLRLVDRARALWGRLMVRLRRATRRRALADPER